MKLQAVFCLLALSSSMVNLFCSPAQAESEQDTSACEAAITSAKERIFRGRNITAVKVNARDHSQYYLNPPVSRPLTINLSLSGGATPSVMESPVFQRAIASDIIKSCTSVGAVGFSQAQTDWVSEVGLMPNGTIQQFECVTPNGENSVLPWGKYSCI
jgi:hypothetical protein